MEPIYRFWNNIPENLKNRLTWLYSNEIEIAQKILAEQLKTMTDLEFENAINDLNSFEEKCRQLVCNEMIYNPFSIEVKTPERKYSIYIHAKKKTLLKSIKDYFRK